MPEAISRIAFRPSIPDMRSAVSVMASKRLDSLKANAKRLIITHFSPRYAMEASITPEELLQEARAVFPATEMAHDFLTVDVARRNPLD